jgi:hypothetical protein
MKKITSVTELKESILLLEIDQAREKILLKEQFVITYESFKPINLIKNTISKWATSPNIKEKLLDATMGITAGYLSKKAAVGSTHNPIKQLVGSLLQMGVASIVTKNADGIKSGVIDLIGNFLSKRKREF